MTRRVLPCALLVGLGSVVACTTEPTELPTAPALSEYMLAARTDSDSAIAYRVDSTIYDPAAGGTSVETRSQTWSLEPQDAPGASSQLFLVTKRDSTGQGEQQFWSWDLLSENGGITNTLNGITYLSLTSPLSAGSTWDALVFTEPDLILPIAEEPIAIHKDWRAGIDSVGTYSYAGREVEAVFVHHATSENRIELRQVYEVYGRGLGLLERRVAILNSQNLEDLPWSQKAEKGFTLLMRRIN